MIESNPGPGGAITHGIYQTQASDIITAADPGIDIEVISDAPGQDETLELEIEVVDDHFDNLLETVLKDGDKRKKVDELVADLITQYDEDVRSRDQWEKTYREGLKLLGLQIEERTEPWSGACGVFSPLITEAVVRFQSEAITETFPANGPVKTQVIGKQTAERLASAERVKEDINWRLTEEMPEYRV